MIPAELATVLGLSVFVSVSWVVARCVCRPGTARAVSAATWVVEWRPIDDGGAVVVLRPALSSSASQAGVGPLVLDATGWAALQAGFVASGQAVFVEESGDPGCPRLTAPLN